MQRRRLNQFTQLRDRLHAGDRSGDRGIVEDPQYRALGRRGFVARSDVGHGRLGHIPVDVAEALLQPIMSRRTDLPAHTLAAREKAAGEWRACEEAEPLLLAQRHRFGFEARTRHERVVRLERFHPAMISQMGSPDCVGDPPSRKVRGADVAHQSAVHETVEDYRMGTTTHTTTSVLHRFSVLGVHDQMNLLHAVCLGAWLEPSR